MDDALFAIIQSLLKRGTRIKANRGKAREFTGVLVQLSDPRARFSRTEGRATLISSVGETLWYLSGSDRLSHIEYYIPKYREYIGASRRAVRAPGAYGPRLFRGGDRSQMSLLIATLKEKLGRSDTRQAVAQIFQKSDLDANNKDVPCTTTMQFLPRNGRLHMITTMRSNDIYRGFPNDVFAFTFIQEIACRHLNLELGTYSHFVGSLHLYDEDVDSARSYLREGFPEPMSMPPMPLGNPASSIDWLLRVEKAVRLGCTEPSCSGVNEYWQDLARLLRVKVLHRAKDMRGLASLKAAMSNPVYDAIIRGRQRAVQRRVEAQLPLPGIQPS